MHTSHRSATIAAPAATPTRRRDRRVKPRPIDVEAARGAARALVEAATPQVLRVVIPSSTAPIAFTPPVSAGAAQNPDAVGPRLRSELDHWLTSLHEGTAAPITRPQAWVDELIGCCLAAPQRFPSLAADDTRQHDARTRRAFTLAVMAVATAMRLGWPVDAIGQAGLAGVLADVALNRAGACAVGDEAVAEVDHPILGLALLEPLGELEPRVRLAILQHHEREDGSGYPFAARRDAICDLARVLAVADSYATAISAPGTPGDPSVPRPKLPYTAMEETSRAAARRVLWQPAARGLLEAVGVFPVGSRVKLSDGRTARVEASCLSHPDRPVVHALDARAKPVGDPIDLSRPDAARLSIVRAVDASMAA